MTIIPCNPEMSQSDGPMYPAQEDNCFPVHGHSDVVALPQSWTPHFHSYQRSPRDSSAHDLRR